MSQYVTTGKNPPWARGAVTAATGLAQGPPAAVTPGLGTSILTAQPAHTPASAAPTLAAAGVSTTGLAAAAVVAAQTQQASQQAPPASTYGTSLAAISLTQSALQQGAVLSQPGIALPASLASATPSGVVVDLARLPQPGLALPTTLAATQVATVSYPAPRLLGQTTQFQATPVQVQTHAQQAAVAQQQQQQQQQQAAPKQRVFTGTVTKLHDNFGFVDEDVFFQLGVVKGSVPKVGERVLVEAAYNPNMPFKWNATRIQVLPNQLNVLPASCSRSVLTATNALGQTNVSAAGATMTLALTQGIPSNIAAMVCQSASVQNPYGNVAQQNTRIVNSVSSRRLSPPPPQRDRERERENRRDERRDRFREREYDRYSPAPRKRSRSPKRTTQSPARRRPRIIPRYSVQLPKLSLDMRDANVMELRKRYTNMYVPSDFCCAQICWQDAFPPHQSLHLDHQCSFHIMNKDVNPVQENDAVLEPSDADHRFSAKVMLMSLPSIKEIYKKSCELAEDSQETKETFTHPTRLISFLIGLKGKTETVAIGGPWSPSLDGADPETDPQVLIRTAIRTCKALTGIDLSGCSQWYRFVEIYYRRGESNHKGRMVSPRVETVVIFLPDVWSCLPTRLQWDGLINSYKKQFQKKLHEDADDGNEIQDDVNQDDHGKKDPCRHSELDPKTMKVNELKCELESRNLSTKGLKSQLIARLTKSIKAESELEEKQGSDQMETDDETEKQDTEEAEHEKKKKEEDNKKQKEQKDKLASPSERHYQLPDKPSIIIHPSRKARNGKFNCSITSLSVLLDYRQADNKEHTFEVSLFAELFNEMLMRDFGFAIYRKLARSSEEKNEKDVHVKKENADDDTDNEEDTDDDDNEDRRERRRKRQKKVQMRTVDPSLLLSCIYFDQTHCGYILEKDLEELIYMLGLKLSRAQVRKVLQKTCQREMFHYRKITDKPQSEALNNHEHLNEVMSASIEKLGCGNHKFFPIFKTKAFPTAVNVTNGKHLTNGETADDCDEKETSLPIIVYQGNVIDVQKLVHHLERRERANSETEQKLKELQEQLRETQEKVKSSEHSVQKINTELLEQQQKLKATEDELKKVQSTSEKYRKSLANCQDQLHSLHSSVQSVLRRGSSRSGSSHNSETRSDNSVTQSKDNKGDT